MTPDWCAEMWIILSNTHVEQCRHVDMWLKKLLRLGKARGVELLEPLAGYGHRISMTISQAAEERWGGAWLPNIPGQYPMSADQIDDIALAHAPPELLEWKTKCEECMGKRMERNDVVPFPLVFPPPARLYNIIGVYKLDAHVFNQEVEVPVQKRVFQKAPPLHKRKGGPWE